MATDERERIALRIARAALETAASERFEFVTLRCGSDIALRDRVVALLSAMAIRPQDAAAREARDALIGSSLGPFRVLDRIGRGGMGVVYRAEREGADFSQTVAIKLIRSGFDFDDVHARFLRERRILARLSHPNLARFIDGGMSADGRPWFALEYVRGEPIVAWCDSHSLSVDERVRLFINVCVAVQYAHTQLIVHRDLKPGNVLVDETGSIKLLDFGIAGLLEGDDTQSSAMTQLGARRGMTPEYAAPEQFSGAPAGVATDVYSLGVLLYQMLAGVLPYAIDRLDPAAAERIVRETPPQFLVAAIQRVTGSDWLDAPQPRPETLATGVWSDVVASNTPTSAMQARGATLATTVWPQRADDTHSQPSPTNLQQPLSTTVRPSDQRVVHTRDSALDADAVTLATDVWPGGIPADVSKSERVCASETIGTGVWPGAAKSSSSRQGSSNSVEAPSIATQAALPALDPKLVAQVIETRLKARRTTLKHFRRRVRGDLARVLDKALAKEPMRRYTTVDAFAEDLTRWLGGAPVRATGNGLGYRLGKFVKRNRVAVAIAATLLLGLLVATGFALFSARQERIQRDAAIDEAGRANAVREYVMLMFGDAAQRHGAGNLTARDILKQGAEEIFERFKDKPQAGQETALSLGELYMQIGDVEGAAPLFERLLQWPGIDGNPAVLASARYDLAQIQYMRGKGPLARTLLDSAQAFWSTQPQRFELLLNESRSAQAQLERAEGKPEVAVRTLENAIAQRRGFLDKPDPEVGSELNALTLALIDLGQYAQAVTRATEGYKVFQDLDQTHSAAALALVNNRAIAQLMLGHFDAAEADYREVVDQRRKLYGESPELAAAQGNLALAITRQNRYDEAIALLEDSLRMGLALSGDSGRETMMARASLAEAYAITGRGDKALPLAQSGVAIAIKHYGADSAFAAVAYRARAWARIATGDDAGARADVESATAIFTAMGKGGAANLPSLQPLRDRLKPVR